MFRLGVCVSIAWCLIFLAQKLRYMQLWRSQLRLVHTSTHFFLTRFRGLVRKWVSIFRYGSYNGLDWYSWRFKSRGRRKRKLFSSGMGLCLRHCCGGPNFELSTNWHINQLKTSSFQPISGEFPCDTIWTVFQFFEVGWRWLGPRFSS